MSFETEYEFNNYPHQVYMCIIVQFSLFKMPHVINDRYTLVLLVKPLNLYLLALWKFWHL